MEGVKTTADRNSLRTYELPLNWKLAGFFHWTSGY